MKELNTTTTIQIAWETLNGVLYDLTKGDPADAEEAVEYLIKLLEQAGANQSTKEKEDESK